jgi:hypothetical protein
MKTKMERTLSRREFAQQAALISTASLVPSQVMGTPAHSAPAPQESQNAPKLTDAGQTEADSRYQQILVLYSDRLNDSQKANIKRMCAELQPSLERIRNFKLENGDAPAVFLKPLVERDKKPQSPSKSAASAAKP